MSQTSLTKSRRISVDATSAKLPFAPIRARSRIDWIVAHARERGCTEIDLDSGVQRFDAHRFYLGRGMKISSHHFSMGLKQA